MWSEGEAGAAHAWQQLWAASALSCATGFASLCCSSSPSGTGEAGLGVEDGVALCWHEREWLGVSGDMQQPGLHPVTGSPSQCSILPAGAAVPA